MKNEKFPKPVYKEPDSHSGAFDTEEMRQLREQLAAQEELDETASAAIDKQRVPATEYEAINQAWDDAEKSETSDLAAEPDTPEEVHTLVEELNRMHAGSVKETEAVVQSAAEGDTVDPANAEAVEPVFEEMTVRENVGNALADIEIAFGNSSHEIVQTARVMTEQIVDHLNTKIDTESQAAWEHALQGKIDNLLQLRSDFVGPEGQKMNAEDSMDGVMPNAFQLQPELASKRRAEILAESGVSAEFSDPKQPQESGDFRIEDLDSLESDFSDASVSAEAANYFNDVADDSKYTERHAAVAAARGAALTKNYKPSGVPLGYDPKAPRTQVNKPKPKKKGFLARLFGA